MAAGVTTRMPWHVVVLAACLTLAASGWAAEPISPFLGTYRGQGVADPDHELSARDLDVTIAPVAGGFSVAWTTAVRGEDGTSRRKSYTIEFEPSGRVGIFASRMRTNMFGERVPNDPLRGVPYVWARLNGPTLSVYALLITDDGGYEMQVYHRTLADGGLALKFLRLREGEAVRTVTALLKRVSP